MSTRQLGVFTPVFYDRDFEAMLDTVKEMGLDAIEPGTGNYAGNKHCNPDELLEDEAKLNSFKRALEDRGVIISALSCHGNPLHPDGSIAKAHDEVTRKAIGLAEKLGVDTITCFSGCPGASDTDKYPNWITCAWPDDYPAALKWQWEEKVIPYWREIAKFASDHGVTKIALEMHPGFVAYNPESLLRLREAVGNTIGANFDPSHLFWQGIDPIAALHKLGKAVYHVHAKDTKVDQYNATVNGVLDTKSLADIQNRSWIFRIVGYGHGLDFWKDFVSHLRKIGYDYVMSIEYEDALMSVKEGMQKTVNFLKEVLIREEPPQIWWA